jgi:hypothetical protein
MRLNLILPKVEPTQFEFPKKCRRKGCPGMRFIPQQEVSKKIVDAQHPEETAWRCECKKCGHVFRVYPKGVSQKHISKRVNGMAVMLYIIVIASVAGCSCPLDMHPMPLSAFADHIGYAINTQVTRGWSSNPSPGDGIGVFNFGQLLDGMRKGNLASLTPCDLSFDDAIASIKDDNAHVSILSVYTFVYRYRLHL